jgi:hypothetical protein
VTWLETLRKAVKEFGMRRVAADLEYSRAAVSLVLNGKYNACTDRIAARVLAIYGELPCPFLRVQIPAAQCRDFRERPVPTNSAQQIHHWRTCRDCKVGDNAVGTTARSFMVPGAAKNEILVDLRSAVDRAISKGTTLDEFRKSFDSIVANHGRGGNAPDVATADRGRR